MMKTHKYLSHAAHEQDEDSDEDAELLACEICGVPIHQEVSIYFLLLQSHRA